MVTEGWFRSKHCEGNEDGSGVGIVKGNRGMVQE